MARTCHRRGIHALGDIAAGVTAAGTPASHADLTEEVARNIADGCDGIRVVHAGLVPAARQVLEERMP